MHPLTCTWQPILYTDYGYSNFNNWIKVGGFDNVSFNQNGKVMKLLTLLSIENLLHPFQTFILGQKNLAPKLAAKLGIDLVFYGENEAEYGNPIADGDSAIRDWSYFTAEDKSQIYLGGTSILELGEDFGVEQQDLKAYMPANPQSIRDKNIQVQNTLYLSSYH